MDPESTSRKSELFQEICYMSRITALEAFNFQNILFKRVRAIERQVDNHYELITNVLLQKKKIECEK